MKKLILKCVQINLFRLEHCLFKPHFQKIYFHRAFETMSNVFYGQFLRDDICRLTDDFHGFCFHLLITSRNGFFQFDIFILQSFTIRNNTTLLLPTFKFKDNSVLLFDTTTLIFLQMVALGTLTLFQNIGKIRWHWMNYKEFVYFYIRRGLSYCVLIE